MAREHSDSVAVIGVGAGSTSNLQNWLSTNGVNTPININNNRVFGHYGVSGTPTNILLDASGKEIGRPRGLSISGVLSMLP